MGWTKSMIEEKSHEISSKYHESNKADQVGAQFLIDQSDECEHHHLTAWYFQFF